MASDIHSPLMIALQQKQQELGLNDAAMARRLHISKSLWSLIKSEDRRMSRQFLEGVIAAFPELSSEVVILLRSRATSSTRSGAVQHHAGPAAG